MTNAPLHVPDDYQIFENDRGEMMLVYDTFPGTPDPAASLVLLDGRAELRFAGRASVLIADLHPESRTALAVRGAVLVIEMERDRPKHAFTARVAPC